MIPLVCETLRSPVCDDKSSGREFSWLRHATDPDAFAKFFDVFAKSFDVFVENGAPNFFEI